MQTRGAFVLQDVSRDGLTHGGLAPSSACEIERFTHAVERLFALPIRGQQKPRACLDAFQIHVALGNGRRLQRPRGALREHRPPFCVGKRNGTWRHYGRRGRQGWWFWWRRRCRRFGCGRVHVGRVVIVLRDVHGCSRRRLGRGVTCTHEHEGQRAKSNTRADDIIAPLDHRLRLAFVMPIELSANTAAMG
jgi:hypothetical protein